MDEITHRVGSDKDSDDALSAAVLHRAHELGLPVTADNVHIDRSEDRLRIDVRYSVTIRALLYQVDIHFYPGAGSR